MCLTDCNSPQGIIHYTMEDFRKFILLVTIFSFMSVGWGQDCVDGVEVELWNWCYNIEETTILNPSYSSTNGQVIPSEIGQLINLTSVYLDGNNL